MEVKIRNGTSFSIFIVQFTYVSSLLTMDIRDNNNEPGIVSSFE